MLSPFNTAKAAFTRTGKHSTVITPNRGIKRAESVLLNNNVPRLCKNEPSTKAALPIARL